MEHLLLGEFYSLIHTHDGFGGQAVDKEDTAPARPPAEQVTQVAVSLGEAGAGGGEDKGDQGLRGKRSTRAGTSLIILPTDATPRSWLSSLRNCEKMHVCYVSTPVCPARAD